MSSNCLFYNSDFISPMCIFFVFLTNLFHTLERQRRISQSVACFIAYDFLGGFFLFLFIERARGKID